MLRRILVLFAVIAVALPAFAEDEEYEPESEIDFARSGPYLAASVAFGWPKFRDEISRDLEILTSRPRANEGHAEEADQGKGLNVKVGYRFHPRFAAEVQYEWLDGFEISIDPLNGNRPVLEPYQNRDVDFVVTANLKFYVFKGRFQPFLVGGVGAMRGAFRQIDDRPPIPKVTRLPSAFTANLTNQETCALDATCNKQYTEMTARFGGGFDYYVTEHIVANATFDYVYPTGQLHKQFDYISLSFGAGYRF